MTQIQRRNDLLTQLHHAVAADTMRKQRGTCVRDACVLVHRETGARYRANGVPRGVRPGDLDPVPDGVALERDGVTYKRFATRGLALQYIDEQRATAIAEFMAACDEMTDEQLQGQAEYWLAK